MSEEKVKKSKWGLGIIALNAVFVIFIISLVIFASNNDFELVETNYYENEVNYQDKIDKIKNANQLLIKPVWSVNPTEKILILKFPEDQTQKGVTGFIHLFRPSDAANDSSFDIILDQSGLMLIPIEKLTSGLWKIKIDWRCGSVEYYIEDTLMME